MTKEDLELIDVLIEKNGQHYNLHKAAEECQELGLVLTQKLLKPNKVDDQEIIDEIGDVEIRLAFLKKLYSPELIEKRIQHKLGNYKKWLETGKYNKF